MRKEIIKKLYKMWADSKEYSEESSLENGIYNECTGKIKNVIGESLYYEVSDFVTDLACETEMSAFEIGLRYGILFAIDMMKGGSAA